MTPDAFLHLVTVTCGLALPPGITADRVRAIAQVESRFNPAAVSPPNRDGSRDYGLMQLNDQWIGRPGFPATTAEAMKLCPNVAAGIRILADADRQAYCIYNTGRPNCRNGYPEKVQAALAQAAAPPSPAPAPTPAAAAPPCAPAWDSWALALCNAPRVVRRRTASEAGRGTVSASATPALPPEYP